MKIWITWERHRRSVELAEAFGCEYREIDHNNLPRPLRYLRSALDTVAILFGRRFSVVFVQSPSIFLAWIAAMLKPLRGYVLVIDAHNAIPNYAGNPDRILRGIVGSALRRADWTFISNGKLADSTKVLGGTPIVLPDRLPDIGRAPLPARFADMTGPLFTLICSYNWDEPIGEFLEAASGIDEPFTLVITGRKSKAGSLLRYESDRVIFADYIPAGEFEGLIQNSDLLIDLTTDEKVLVCGAYEAVSVGVPVLLIGSEIARRVFAEGGLYAENSVEDYRRVIREYLSHPERYSERMRTFKPQFEKEWNDTFEPIRRIIEESVRS